MGKTTMCKKIVHDFYQNALWRNLYDRVVWIPLRKLSLEENQTCDIVELIRKEYSLNVGEKNLTEKLKEAIIDCTCTLFILDGLEEVSHTVYRVSSLGIVLNALLARSHALITSQPMLRRHLCEPEVETTGVLPQ